MEPGDQIPAGAYGPQRVILGAGVSRITDEALAQFAAAASLPGCVRAAAMPDLHPGRGIPVGASFAMSGVVYPHLVGSDIGCGARVVFTDLVRVSRDRLERKLRHAFTESSPLLDSTLSELFRAAWLEGPRGLLSLAGLPELIGELCRTEPVFDGLPPSGDPNLEDPSASSLLGTIGGGNHFVEVSLVQQIADASTADRLGIVKGHFAVVVHSGSRGLGEAVGSRWQRRGLDGDEMHRYLGQHAGACRFATTNRLLLANKVLKSLGITRIGDLRGHFDIIHNDVRPEPFGSEKLWVHRKGAAPAYDATPTVVLGSRGAPSWIMLGRGSESALRSVAHGAGRRMSRSEARSKLKSRYRREELARSSFGGRVLCDDSALLYEEHPDAYKPMEPIVGALENAGTASRVASLVPVMTVKL
jgi:release factor H-coupled RctB family protein